MKSYKDLDIYKLSFDLAIKIHKMSLRLPKHELYEIGSQIRRASHSVKSNIIEGYGRRDYKQDFIRFLVFAEASQLETLSDLEIIEELYPDLDLHIDKLINDCKTLGKKINSFKSWVINNWKTSR